MLLDPRSDERVRFEVPKEGTPAMERFGREGPGRRAAPASRSGPCSDTTPLIRVREDPWRHGRIRANTIFSDRGTEGVVLALDDAGRLVMEVRDGDKVATIGTIADPGISDAPSDFGVVIRDGTETVHRLTTKDQ
jgi:hypothetical protein